MSLILSDPTLFGEWRQDIQTMAHRIIAMRSRLHSLLTVTHKTPGPVAGAGGESGWEHILQQIGMFSFTGLNPAQTKELVERQHVYLTGNGR